MSSTGHLILAGDLLDFDHPSRDVFYIAIQTGAMLAVLWEYRARFFRVDLQLWRNLIIAFIPAAVIGLAVGSYIKAYLFKPVPVALAFIVGGVIILLVDRGERKSRVESTRAMTALDALKVDTKETRAVFPQHGEHRAGLDREVEHVAARMIEVEQVAGEDQVAGARHRQELGQALDDAED